MTFTLTQRFSAEALGTTFLLAVVVGSGIMAERLAGGNAAIALLANALATGAGLYALIAAFGAVLAHLNPAVTLFAAWRGELAWRDVPAYVVAQCLGAVLGVWTAHLMFAVDVLQQSTRVRSGGAQWFAEWVATLGLLVVIAQVSQSRRDGVAAAVAAYITAAYWFTASTSFANPAVTLARSFTESFAGIRMADVPHFVMAQLLAIPAAVVVVRFLILKKTLAPQETTDATAARQTARQ